MKILSALCSIALLTCPLLANAQGLLYPTPGFQFTAVDGRAVDLAKLKGKVVLIDFWATWCPPCVAEVPNVVKVYKKYHDQGFEIIGISLDTDKRSLLNFIKKNDMSWPQYFIGDDAGEEVARKYGVVQYPEMWLIDRNGRIATKAAYFVDKYGRPTSMDPYEDLSNKVEKLLR